MPSLWPFKVSCGAILQTCSCCLYGHWCHRAYVLHLVIGSAELCHCCLVLWIQQQHRGCPVRKHQSHSCHLLSQHSSTDPHASVSLATYHCFYNPSPISSLISPPINTVSFTATFHHCQFQQWHTWMQSTDAWTIREDPCISGLEPSCFYHYVCAMGFCMAILHNLFCYYQLLATDLRRHYSVFVWHLIMTESSLQVLWAET